jgi:hypothetical protein
MLDLKVGDSVKVTPLDTTVFEYVESIIGKVFMVNSIKQEMIVIGYQYDMLVGWSIPLTSKGFIIESIELSKQESDVIDKYTSENFYQLPIKDIAESKHIYREILTKNFGRVTVCNTRVNKYNNLIYKCYECKNMKLPESRTLYVNVIDGELISEGAGEYKDINLDLAKKIHAELKVGKEQKIYKIAMNGLMIHTTNTKADAKWFVYTLLANDFVPDLSEIEIFSNKI